MKSIYLSMSFILIGFMFFTAMADSNFESYHKPNNAILKQRLTAIQYQVTQEKGTEPPYNNVYWDNKKPGIYVDIVSGEPLFSSIDKYDSKTGWPSFTKPLESNNIILKEDNSLGMVRVEVISRHANSHLGHLFNDGPPPTYQRYCMNSAALMFVPAEDLQKKGYAKYQYLFKKNTQNKN